MPSPFPGMDPYLEGSLWTTLHHSLGTEIVRQLAPKLCPRYVALPASIPMSVWLQHNRTPGGFPDSDGFSSIALAAALPTVPVPLLADDSDVTLDLQAAFTAAYDVPGYDLIVDYSEPPDVPLSDKETAWVHTHLQSVGLRE